jgi:hypothetical protein
VVLLQLKLKIHFEFVVKSLKFRFKIHEKFTETGCGTEFKSEAVHRPSDSKAAVGGSSPDSTDFIFAS